MCLAFGNTNSGEIKRLPEKKARGTETLANARAQLSQEICKDPIRNSSKYI